MSETTLAAIAAMKTSPAKFEQIAGFERRATNAKTSTASGKTDTGAGESAGRTFANQAKEARLRQLLLAAEFKSGEPLKAGYAAAMQRFNRLQNTPGLMDIVLSYPSGAKLFCPHMMSHEDHSSGNSSGTKQVFRNYLSGEIGNFKQVNVLSSLANNLSDLKLAANNQQVTDKIDGLVQNIHEIQDIVFSSASTNYLKLRRDPKTQDSNGIFSEISASANHAACAGIAPASAYGQLKTRLGAILRDSYSLAKQAFVITQTAEDGAYIQSTISTVENSVMGILSLSDTILQAEYKVIGENN